MVKHSEKLSFPGAAGDLLAARLDLPDGEPRAYALFAHCFTCTKDIFAAARIAGALADSGIAVLRFDFTGLGHSAGEFANTNFSSNVADLVRAADFLRSTRAAPMLLIGHSLGGAAILAAAPEIPEARAVATIGAPAGPAHVAQLFQETRPEIEARGEAEVLLAGRRFRIKKEFLEDISRHNLEPAIGTLRKALLVFHGPLDRTVGIENAGWIFSAAKHPKSFVSLDDADHLLSRKADAVYVAAVLAAWATRYLGAPKQTEDRPSPGSVEPGQVLVEETGAGRFALAIAAGAHRLAADEPLALGGTDSGPTPYDLLLAALGACKTMTMRMYAERKGFPLDRARVTLRHDKIHAEDCAACETEFGRIDRIETVIEVIGDMDADTRQKIADIAEKCPVHRTLQSEVVIESRHKVYGSIPDRRTPFL